MHKIAKATIKFLFLFFLGTMLGLAIAYLLQFNSNFINNNNPIITVIIIIVIVFVSAEIDILVLEKYFALVTDFYFFTKQISPFVVGVVTGLMGLMIDENIFR